MIFFRSQSFRVVQAMTGITSSTARKSRWTKSGVTLNAVTGDPEIFRQSEHLLDMYRPIRTPFKCIDQSELRPIRTRRSRKLPLSTTSLYGRHCSSRGERCTHDLYGSPPVGFRMRVCTIREVCACFWCDLDKVLTAS